MTRSSENADNELKRKRSPQPNDGRKASGTNAGNRTAIPSAAATKEKCKRWWKSHNCGSTDWQPGWWALKAPNFSRATLQNAAQALGRCQMGLELRQKRFHYHQSGNVLRRNTEGEKAQTPLPIWIIMKKKLIMNTGRSKPAPLWNRNIQFCWEDKSHSFKCTSSSRV